MTPADYSFKCVTIVYCKCVFECRCLGGMKCPQCEFVYGTKWELNRHLKSKHNLKVMEGSWEVNTKLWSNCSTALTDSWLVWHNYNVKLLWLLIFHFPFFIHTVISLRVILFGKSIELKNSTNSSIKPLCSVSVDVTNIRCSFVFFLYRYFRYSWLNKIQPDFL